MKSNTFIKHAMVAAIASTSFFGLTATAHAQEATAASDDSGEIIVSARRRNESIQSTPVAVSAISPAQLDSTAALTIGDLQGAAPNVLITSGGTGASAANISIRGIAFADIEKSFDPAVAVNIDGVYIGTSTGQMLDFFDIGSIEILRGPQGTLFGRNTIAGVINIKRTKPTGELGAKLEAELSSFNHFGGKVVVNTPIVRDVLAAKLFGMYSDGSGFYHDALKNGQLRGGSKNKNFGGSLLFTPGSNFEALYTFDKQLQNFDPVLGALSRTGDAFAPFLPPHFVDGDVTKNVYRVGAMPADLYGRYKSFGHTGEMNLDLGGVKLTSVTSYRKQADSMKQDYATASLYQAERVQNYRQFSQELRASGKIGDTFDYVAGVYYFNSRYHIDQYTSVFFASPTHQNTTGWSKSLAGFVDFNWEIFDKVRISGGGRYTHDKKSLETAFTDPNNAAASFVGPKTSKSWNKFTPKIGIDYRPNRDLMVYASWSRGYRSGGFNGRGLTPYSSGLPYNPETVDAYEIGLKSEWLDRKLTLNLAAFYSNYKDIQQTSTVQVAGIALPETVVINAAKAKIKGFEADMTLRPMDRLTLRGSFGYTDAKFKGFLVNQPVTGLAGTSTYTFDYSGVNLIYAPKVTASISGEYTQPISDVTELKLNAGYRYLARYDQQVAADGAAYAAALAAPAGSTIVVGRNDPRLRSDAQNLVDLSASLVFNINDRTKYSVTGFVRNVLNDRGTQTSFVAGLFPVFWGFSTAREPRVFGVKMGLEF